MKLETSKTTAGDAGASIATKGDEWGYTIETVRYTRSIRVL